MEACGEVEDSLRFGTSGKVFGDRAQSQNIDWPLRIIIVGEGKTCGRARGLVYRHERIHHGC